jgi:two-component system, LuxR family, sensor kinase FixL
MEDDRTAHALRLLQLNEARWQAILDTARDAIICIDRHGEVTLFNRAAEAIFGYAADDVLGRNVRMLMPVPYQDEHDTYLANYHATGTAKAIGRIREVQACRKNGEVFPIELSVSEARVGDHVIYSAFIRDVSERRAMEDALGEARRIAGQRERLADIGAITARIVHDLGNPLAGLSMQAQLIQRRVTRNPDRPSQDLRAPAERIVSEVKRLDGLVKDFLDFARQQRLDVRTIALPSFLQQVLDLWQPVAAARDIELTLDVTPELTDLNADEQKLHRVLDNLVKNAVEAIDHGPGQVALQARRGADERVRITVTDDGPGVPQNVELFKLFETTKRNGSGLGLSISKQIILAHGGNIGFERLAPHGTAFHVDLPARVATV